MAKLRYNLTFPYRWLKEDRKYFKKNLTNLLPKNKSQLPMHVTLLNDEPAVLGYGARITTHSYQPKSYKMDKEEMTELLSDVFPMAKCLVFEKFFKQKELNTGLPVMELEIYY